MFLSGWSTGSSGTYWSILPATLTAQNSVSISCILPIVPRDDWVSWSSGALTCHPTNKCASFSYCWFDASWPGFGKSLITINSRVGELNCMISSCCRITSARILPRWHATCRKLAILSSWTGLKRFLNSAFPCMERSWSRKWNFLCAWGSSPGMYWAKKRRAVARPVLWILLLSASKWRLPILTQSDTASCAMANLFLCSQP